MLKLLRDKLRTATLRAQHERQLHEQLIALAEATYNQPVSADAGDWTLLGANQRSITQQDREDARTRSRRLARNNPHAANILRMLESYVAGPKLDVSHKPDNDQADKFWADFLTLNARHYSYREHARRAWRDGEAFLRIFPTAFGAPHARFIDPELIAPDPTAPETQGIITHPNDNETPIYYLRIDPTTNQIAEKIPADQILHTKIGADSNEKRGTPRLHTVATTLECYESWTDTELKARKLQASIVLWRKVQGTPTAVETLANSLASDLAATDKGRPNDPYRQERFRPGTILSTNKATEIEFLQPKTNIRDAVPLGRMLLLAAAAGAGMPEFMLTSDASNANYASTMIAEGPAVKLFESEQHWFANELTILWRMATAGRFPKIQPHWQFPTLVNRDKYRERDGDHQAVDRQVISRAEACRREGLDPDQMREEIKAEADLRPTTTPPSATATPGGDSSHRYAP